MRSPVKTKPLKLGSNSSKERKKLIKECDALVSLIVRARDKRCIEIKCENPYERLTCSHLIKRGRSATRFDLTNCNCHCAPHNFRHNSYPEIYLQWWIDKYGLKAYNDLVEKSRLSKKWTLAELRELKEKLQQELEKYK